MPGSQVAMLQFSLTCAKDERGKHSVSGLRLRSVSGKILRSFDSAQDQTKNYKSVIFTKNWPKNGQQPAIFTQITGNQTIY